MPKKLSEIKRKKIEELLLNTDASIKSIAEQVHVSKMTVYNIKDELESAGKYRNKQADASNDGPEKHGGFRTPNNQKRYVISRY